MMQASYYSKTSLNNFKHRTFIKYCYSYVSNKSDSAKSSLMNCTIQAVHKK